MMMVKLSKDCISEFLKTYAEQVVERTIKENHDVYLRSHITKDTLKDIVINRFIRNKSYDQSSDIYSANTVIKWCKLMQPYAETIMIEIKECEVINHE